MSTWRDEPFKKGTNYRVLKDFKSLRTLFSEGEILKFKESAYSRYDCMTGYIFEDTKGDSWAWDIHDDDELEVWKELFVEVKV